MKSNSLLKQSTIKEFKKVHNIFLWAGTCIIILGLIVGAIAIFANDNFDITAKIQGTIWILAAMLFISVNNFIRIEKGNKITQSFALTSFVANIIWAILGIMMIWGIFVPIEYKYKSYDLQNSNSYEMLQEYDRYDYDYEDTDDIYDFYDDYDDYVYTQPNYDIAPSPSGEVNVLTRIFAIALSIASTCFWISNILVIKETIKSIKPLKITAIVCQVYIGIILIIFAFVNFISIDGTMLKFLQLTGLAESAFVITALAAWIISRTHKPEYFIELTDSTNKPVINPTPINNVDNQNTTPIPPETTEVPAVNEETQEEVVQIAEK